MPVVFSDVSLFVEPFRFFCEIKIMKQNALDSPTQLNPANT